MKQYFAEYRYHVRQFAKALGISGPGPLPQGFFELAENQLRKEMKGDAKAPIGKDMASASYIELQVMLMEQKLLYDRKGTHFFVESTQLENFLIHSVRKFYTKVWEEIDLGIVHTANRAVFFSVVGEMNDQMMVIFCCSTGYFCFRVGDAEKMPFVQVIGRNQSPSVGTEEAKKMVKLVYGLAMYKACFPESIKDGFPDFAKHPSHYKRQVCSSVRAVSQIVDRSGPIPHFRNAHFRMLRSPKFKNKRWQLVPVSETFVRGTPKTVAEPTVSA